MSEPREKLDISDLKDTFLECPVCVEHFNQTDRRPRLLHSCLHAFCTQCLHQLLQKEGKGQITCPLCRQVQKVKGKADTLPLDPLRSKLVEYVQIKHKKKVLCTDCPDGNYAEGRCHECHIYLCTSCKNAHKRNTITRKHDIVSLEEMLRQPIKSLVGHKCPQHPDHKIEFFCTQCNELCCLSCTVLTHKNHALQSVENAAREKVSDFESQISQLNITVGQVRSSCTRIRKETAEEKRKLECSTTSINNQFDEIIKLLNRRRSVLLSEVKASSEQTVASLGKQYQATEDTLAVMESVNEYFHQMKSKSDDCEILAAAPGLEQTLNFVTSDKRQDQSSSNLSLMFLPRNMDQVGSFIASLGEVKKSQQVVAVKKLADDIRTPQEARGAVGGISYTFVSDASKIRDLEVLATIEKWVGGGKEAGGCDFGDETYPMSYESKQRRQEKFCVPHPSATKKPDDHLMNRGRKKSNRTAHISSDTSITEDVTEYSFDLPGGVKIMVYYGNLIKVKTEGIVNATNSELKNYAGVAGAVERACGITMRRECERYVLLNGPLNISEVMHTSAGDLRDTNYILHTVGPVYVSSLDEKCGNLLTVTFLRCLDHAGKKLKLHSLAFPFISTGVYAAPLEMCVQSFLDAVLMFSHSHQLNPILTEIHLVSTDQELVQTAIVMIRQHLEQCLDVLVAKAMSRL